jgi:hypothetical protein
MILKRYHLMIRHSRNGSIIAGVYEWLLVVAGEV